MPETLKEENQSTQVLEAPKRPAVYEGPYFTILYQADPYLEPARSRYGYALRFIALLLFFLIGSLL